MSENNKKKYNYTTTEETTPKATILTEKSNNYNNKGIVITMMMMAIMSATMKTIMIKKPVTIATTITRQTNKCIRMTNDNNNGKKCQHQQHIKLMTQNQVTQPQKNIVTAAAVLIHRLRFIKKLKSRINSRLNSLINSQYSLI